MPRSRSRASTSRSCAVTGFARAGPPVEPAPPRLPCRRRGSHVVFLIAAIDLIAGEACARTKILPPGPAELAHTTRIAEPRNADAVAGCNFGPHVGADALDDPDNLVPWNDRDLRIRQFAV